MTIQIIIITIAVGWTAGYTTSALRDIHAKQRSTL